jgi:protease I
MRLQGKKIAILIESDFYEKEIFYYEHRFPEEGMQVHFLTRLWGQPSLTFRGHEHHYPFECHESFEDMDDEMLHSYAAVIVPSTIVGPAPLHRKYYRAAAHSVPQARLCRQDYSQGYHLSWTLVSRSGSRTRSWPPDRGA